MNNTAYIIAIGASTGGTGAIKHILSHLPVETPAILIAHHIPESSCAYFVSWMNSISNMIVCEATDQQAILQGHVYIAPAGQHLEVVHNINGYHCRVTDDAPVSGYKPSVDVLFKSVAREAGNQAIAVLLTGMGSDGVEGLELLQQAGARTLVQDESSSVVWGMAGEAVKRGAADDIIPLPEIAAAILSSVHEATTPDTP